MPERTYERKPEHELGCVSEHISDKKVVVITGPTATGKTALGALIARELGGEVVSADSMQIYKYMDIGAAKPTQEERLGVPHHMLDAVSPLEEYSVARYVTEASQCIDDIIARGKQPFIVGGTGLYIDSLLHGREFSIRADNNLRSSLEKEYDALGADVIHGRLKEIDPAAAARLHPNDKKRIVRALEIYHLSGKTISQHDAETRAHPPRYEALKLALTFADRKDLYARIDKRVDRMFRLGLENEVRTLLDMGVPLDSTAMQAIGYKEVAGALMGEYSMEAAAEMIKQSSRRYAKRQLTWLRRDERVRWIAWDKEPEIEKCARQLIDDLSIGICTGCAFGYEPAE